MREIAKSASCTTGTIYSLYDSKEGLYAGLLDFYLERPEDYDLSFYLYGGARPVGLRPDLNKELNRQAADVIALVADLFAADGVADKERAPALALSAVSQVFGIVLLAKTGRLKSWHQSPQTLLEAYLSLLYTPSSAPKQGKSVRKKRT